MREPTVERSFHDQRSSPPSPVILHPRQRPARERLTNADAMTSAPDQRCRSADGRGGPPADSCGAARDARQKRLGYTGAEVERSGIDVVNSLSNHVRKREKSGIRRADDGAYFSPAPHESGVCTASCFPHLNVIVSYFNDRPWVRSSRGLLDWRGGRSLRHYVRRGPRAQPTPPPVAGRCKRTCRVLQKTRSSILATSAR